MHFAIIDLHLNFEEPDQAIIYIVDGYRQIFTHQEIWQQQNSYRESNAE